MSKVKRAIKVKDGEARIVSTSRYLDWISEVNNYIHELEAEVAKLKGNEAVTARGGGGGGCCEDGCGSPENIDLCGPTFYLCKDGEAGVCGDPA